MRLTFPVLLTIAASLGLLQAGPLTVYDNTASFASQGVTQGPAQTQAGNNTITRLVADDITPTPGFGGDVVTLITFSVANPNSTTVTARPRVRFYLNDGAGGGPGTIITAFTINPIAFSGTGALVSFNPGGPFLLPSGTFFAGITFDDNGGTTGATLAQMGNLGQGVFGPPAVGSSTNSYFETTSAGSFNSNNPPGAFNTLGPNQSFGWQFVVDNPVPEPTSLSLLAIGALLLMRFRPAR